MSKLLITAATAAILAVPVTVAAASNDNDSGSASEVVAVPRDVWQDPRDNIILIDSPLDDTRTQPADDGDNGNDGSRPAKSTPGSLLDLRDWYLTLPTGPDGSPDTVKQPGLTGYSSQYMRLNQAGDGVVFTAHAGGTTTKNSSYPRSELREMQGGELASWDGRQGTHSMEIRQAVTRLPSAKPEVVVGQIHGTDDDLMQIHLSGSMLTVKYDDGQKSVPLNDEYQLGTVFTVRIESAGGRVKVWYDGALKADLAISSGTSYFKAGNYLQTNTEKGDDASATAEVVIYRLTVSHS